MRMSFVRSLVVFRPRPDPAPGLSLGSPVEQRKYFRPVSERQHQAPAVHLRDHPLPDLIPDAKPQALVGRTADDGAGALGFGHDSEQGDRGRFGCRGRRRRSRNRRRRRGGRGRRAPGRGEKRPVPCGRQIFERLRRKRVGQAGRRFRDLRGCKKRCRRRPQKHEDRRRPVALHAPPRRHWLFNVRVTRNGGSSGIC
jgi:hypothetical protein